MRDPARNAVFIALETAEVELREAGVVPQERAGHMAVTDCRSRQGCALGRIRTCDRWIRSPLLYPLSYERPHEVLASTY
jgi:hypothetical protein